MGRETIKQETLYILPINLLEAFIMEKYGEKAFKLLRTVHERS